MVQFSTQSLQFLGPPDHLCIFFSSEGNIASEDSSLSDALVLEDGMLAAVCSREQGGMCELLIGTPDRITVLCNSPLIDARSKNAWFPLTLSCSQASGLEQ